MYTAIFYDETTLTCKTKTTINRGIGICKIMTIYTGRYIRYGAKWLLKIFRLRAIAKMTNLKEAGPNLLTQTYVKCIVGWNNIFKDMIPTLKIFQIRLSLVGEKCKNPFLKSPCLLDEEKKVDISLQVPPHMKKCTSTTSFEIHMVLTFNVGEKYVFVQCCHLVEMSILSDKLLK